MNTYLYDGPVLEFGRCIAQRWKGTTLAISPEKARANLTYQFKKAYNKTPDTSIILPGKVVAA